MTKKELRNFIRLQKGRFSSQELREMSFPIVQKMLVHPRVQAAETILLYHSLPDEVFTHDALELLRRQGKTVLLPAVTDDTHMELHRYDSAKDLLGGFFNIMEPVGKLFDDYAHVEVAVVPGMAFDSRGNRLGRGRGYYDRLLPLLPNAYKMGLCFQFQRLPGIPSEDNDVRMDEVV